LLLAATRKISPTYSANFWDPTTDGYDSDSYHNHEWYNKCLDSSFTSEQALCALPTLTSGDIFTSGGSDKSLWNPSAEWESMSWWSEFERQYFNGSHNETVASYLAHHYHRYLLDTIGSKDSSNESSMDVATGGVDGGNNADPYTKWCLDALYADKILDKLEVLGVGCAGPSPIKITPPEEPCWITDTCPKPEPEKCDSIMREVKTIKKKVKLSLAHNECIDQTSSRAHSDQQMRFWCVKRGLVGDVDANGQLIKEDAKLGFIADLGRDEYRTFHNSNDACNTVKGESWKCKARLRLKAKQAAGVASVSLKWFGTQGEY